METITKLSIALSVLASSACCDEPQIPVHTKALHSGSARVRNEAALALAKCDSPAVDAAVPRLIAMLYDENVGVQSSAAYALRKIDTPAARKALDQATKKSKKRNKGES